LLLFFLLKIQTLFSASLYSLCFKRPKQNNIQDETISYFEGP